MGHNSNKNRPKSIIYVNFSPYENTGKIFDYLLNNFEKVFLFSLDFHRLGPNLESNKLKIYENGKLIKKYNLCQIPVPQNLLYILLPLRSLLNFLQIIIFTIFLNTKYGTISFYFTVNAFTAWIGSILKSFRLVEKTIFWVWDYYPPIHENKIIMLMRAIYWQFDKIASKSNGLAFLNKRLENLRKDIGILPRGVEYPIIPIGTNPIYPKKNKKGVNKRNIVLGFIGVVKKSQGLDIVFDSAEEINKTFPNIKLEIIGAGPDETYFKNRSKNSPIKITFHGLLSEIKKSENVKINQILSKCDIGIAPFIPEESNISYYGDPSKIKMYLSHGLPVITTNVFAFSEEIGKTKSGIIIDYYNKGNFIRAIDQIVSNYRYYSLNARKLAQKYSYRKIYRDIFRISPML